MRSNVTHTHVGDGLTFGCPACIDRVRRLEAEEIVAGQMATAPTRRVTVTWEVRRDGSFTIDIPVPDDWDADDLDGALQWNTGHAIDSLRRHIESRAALEAGVDDCVDQWAICDVGEVIAGAPRPPGLPGQTDLFGGAA